MKRQKQPANYRQGKDKNVTTTINTRAKKTQTKMTLQRQDKKVTTIKSGILSISF